MESSWPRFASGRLFISHLQPNFLFRISNQGFLNICILHLETTTLTVAKYLFGFDWSVATIIGATVKTVLFIGILWQMNISAKFKMQKMRFCVKPNYSTHELWWELSLFFLIFSNFGGKFSDFVDGQQNNTPGLILIKYQYPAHSALLTVLTVLSSLHSSDHHSVLHIVLQLSTVLCTWFSKTLHTTILQCCITIRRLTRTPSSPVPLNIQCSLKDYFLTKVS